MRYHIPAETPCSIARDDENRVYHAHRTTKPLDFDAYRSFRDGAYTFERQGWILLVKAAQVAVSRAEAHE